MRARITLGLLCLVFFLQQHGSASPHDTDDSVRAANAEMSRLAAKLVGDWDSVETMERSSDFPRGGSRSGRVHVSLASGGYVLLYEVHSDGTAGKLEGFHVIWWDERAHLYRFFACFNNANPCADRGTAHWEGEAFVNDYHFEIDGKRIPGRDTFTFTPTAHTLVAAIQSDSRGGMKTLITTRATRQSRSALESTISSGWGRRRD